MNKKILISVGAIIAGIAGVVAMSAYEAHVINVTAHIENALFVDATPIEFGTVFPQEYLEEELTIQLSGSFLAENRVDDVQYIIKQKPKCKLDPSYQGTELPLYAPVGYATHECPEFYLVMESLCPFLSKTDGDPDDQNDISHLSYYIDPTPNAPNSGDEYCETPGTDAQGYLSKEDSDFSDLWIIDLKVPPVLGFIGQDWPAGCPTVKKDSQDYGCDLWVEVTGISETNNENNNHIENNCTPTTEVCNGIDDDCDSLIDEGTSWVNKGESCNVGIGECEATGTYICDSGDPAGPTICSATAGSPITEVCDDGLDNDCDGYTDGDDTADCPPPLNGVCTPNDVQLCDTGEQGVCSDGHQTCDEFGNWEICIRDVEPSAETCNGLDDDCDGNVDESLIKGCYTGPGGTEGVGLCQAGTQTCTAGSWGICTGEITPATEICDDEDNDCDGETDEGDVCGPPNNWTYQQDFNTLTSGNLNGQDSWSGSASYDIQTTVRYEGAKAVEVVGSAPSGIVRDITGISDGLVYVALRVTATPPTGNHAGIILREGASGRMYVRFGSNGYIQISSAGVYQDIMTYNTDQWYVIAIEFDDVAQADKYRAKVHNGTVWSSWTSWYTVSGGSYTSISRIELLGQLGTSETTYFDTITPTP